MRRLTAEDYAVDAVTGAKMLVGAWLCRRLEDGSVVRKQNKVVSLFGVTQWISRQKCATSH
jgi:hypothetical protein